jgi:photosystem II stability/assembly factor-like uncharacterized protein
MRTCLVLLIGLCTMLLLPATSAAAPSAPLPPGWVTLGPSNSDAPIAALVVSPDWPSDGLALAARDGQGMIRTHDRGQHWDFVSAPGVLKTLTVVRSAAGTPLVFGISGSLLDYGPADRSVYRSANLGDDWQSVVDVPHTSIPSFVFSPAFAKDGTVFLRADDRLLRSTDAGQTWAPVGVSGLPRLSPDFAQDGLAFTISNGGALRSRDQGQTWEDAGVAPDEQVMDVQFSPTFASDGLVFAVVRADPPVRNESVRGEDAASSYGIVRSTDRGESWEQAANGLEIDGDPYRAVQVLLISPTFTQDQSLFAFALGPQGPPMPGSGLIVGTRPWALFRSTDAGASWQAVWNTTGYPDRENRTSLVLSPVFAQDGTILRTTVGGLLFSRPSGCRVEVSRDGGATWTDINAPAFGMYWSCGRPRLTGAPGQLVGSIGIGGEGGAGIGVWPIADGDPAWLASARNVSAEPVSAPDGTALVGTADYGVVARGANAVATNGRLTCPIQPTLGFGRVYESSSDVRRALGCALRAEQEVQIHESTLGPDERAYWTDAFPQWWYDVHCGGTTCPAQNGYYNLKGNSGTTPFPKDQERVSTGVAQTFERGVMLYTTPSAGQHEILVLGSTLHITTRQSLSFPDP